MAGASDANNLTIVPPEKQISEAVERYLIENVTILRDILGPGISANFVTVDSKLIVVDRGILIRIEPSFDGLTDAILIEGSIDALLIEAAADKILYEETIP